VTLRRQRYVLQKLAAGVPTDHVAFTRFAALAAAVLPPPVLAQGLRHLVVSSAGSPEQVGAPRPMDDIFAAGLTQSQHYLSLVAEGRIHVRPWMAGIAGRDVTFADGSAETADAILLGTGYRLSLPFLAPDVAQMLDLDEQHIDLHDHTFHPDLDGIAFLGLFDQVGPYLPVLELQARWLAYGWSGVMPMPGTAAMRRGVAACRALRGRPQAAPMHAMALLFARNAGVEPALRPALAGLVPPRGTGPAQRRPRENPGRRGPFRLPYLAHDERGRSRTMGQRESRPRSACRMILRAEQRAIIR
jgi:hypothetical protein